MTTAIQPVSSALLAGLHDNLWSSLRHTFNTDRVMLGVAYALNFGAFLLLLVLLPGRVSAAAIALLCLVLLNVLIFVSLRNSRREAARVLGALQRIYEDNGLGPYFGSDQADYYAARYRLWLILQPSLMVFAVVLALVIRHAP